MEEGPKYADKMKAMGLSADPMAIGGPQVAVEGRGVMSLAAWKEEQKQGATSSIKKTHSTLSPRTRMLEESAYRRANLGGDDQKCEFPNNVVRCYSDSYYPGKCVPDEEICFESKWRQKYLADPKFGMNPDMAWAVTASEKNIGPHAITVTDEEYAKKDMKNKVSNLAAVQKGRQNEERERANIRQGVATGTLGPKIETAAEFEKRTGSKVADFSGKNPNRYIPGNLLSGGRRRSRK